MLEHAAGLALPLGIALWTPGHAHLSFCPCLCHFGGHTEAEGAGQLYQVPEELVQHGELRVRVLESGRFGLDGIPAQPRHGSRKVPQFFKT